MPKTHAVGFVFATAMAPSVVAQTSPIVTDRPSVSYAVKTVAPGHFQIESGVELSRQDGVTTVGAPFATLRAGLADRFELMAFLPSWSRRSIARGSESGLGDLGVGVRKELASGSVGLALLALVSLPTGTDGFSGPTTLRAGMAAERALGSATAFATGLLALQDRDARLAADLELSGGVSRALSRRTSGFVEGFVQARGHAARDGAGGRAGLAVLVSGDLQLDFYAGIDVVGPSTAAGGAGLSIRW